jgi:hypothetical protein
MEDKSMSTADEGVKILTVASCSFVRDEHRSHVVVSGSYISEPNSPATLPASDRWAIWQMISRA